MSDNSKMRILKIDLSASNLYNVSCMNTQYNHIYQSCSRYVAKVPAEALEQATESLKMVKDDEFVTVWAGESYQVFAIKA